MRVRKEGGGNRVLRGGCGISAIFGKWEVSFLGGLEKPNLPHLARACYREDEGTGNLSNFDAGTHYHPPGPLTHSPQPIDITIKLCYLRVR